MKPPLHLMPIVLLTCSTRMTNVFGVHHDEPTNRRRQREPSRVKLSNARQHATRRRRTQQFPDDLMSQLETILGHPIDENVQIHFIDSVDELESWDSSGGGSSSSTDASWWGSSSLSPTYSDWGRSSSSSKSGKSASKGSKSYEPSISGKSQKDMGKSGKGTILSPTMSPSIMILQPSFSPMKETPSSTPSRIDSIVDSSSKPSNAPSETPSETPSTIPSQSPTLKNSEVPSAIPSGMPSLYPSKSPSGMPTHSVSTPTLKPIGKFEHLCVIY